MGNCLTGICNVLLRTGGPRLDTIPELRSLGVGITFEGALWGLAFEARFAKLSGRLLFEVTCASGNYRFDVTCCSSNVCGTCVHVLLHPPRPTKFKENLLKEICDKIYEILQASPEFLKEIREILQEIFGRSCSQDKGVIWGN